LVVTIVMPMSYRELHVTVLPLYNKQLDKQIKEHRQLSAQYSTNGPQMIKSKREVLSHC